MNARAIQAIVRKDLKVVLQSKGVLIPLIIVPVLMFIGLPAVLVTLASTVGKSAEATAQMDALLQRMPPDLLAELAGYTVPQKMIVLGLVYFLAPMYLLVPLMVASAIAADSFAGEKERKTLEALLYTPMTDAELFLGKVCSAWLPAMAIGLAGFVLYGLVANLAAWHLMGRLFFPNAMWIVLVLWVAPAFAALGLNVSVLISARVRTFQEAYQIGAVVVVPVLMLLIAQITGAMYFSLSWVLLLGLLLWGVDAVLLWLGGRSFQRGEIIARL